MDGSDQPVAARSVDSVVLSTETIRAPERFDYWRSCFHAVNDVEVGRESVPAFDGRSEHWRIGPFLLGLTATPQRRLVRTRERIRRDDLDHWAIRLSRRSMATFQTGGRTYVCGPGAALVTSLGESYVEDRTTGDWIGLIFARDAFPQITSRLEALGPDVLARSAASGLLADYLMSLCVRLRAASAEQTPAIAEITRAMLAGCLPSLESDAPDADGEVVQRARIERAIRRNIGSARLDVSRLCALTGVSRSSLYRMFENTGGVAAYVRRLRLRLVDEDLRNPDFAGATITALAERRGFHCAASFSRSYRETFGRSPRETRVAATLGFQPERPDMALIPAPARGPQPLLIDLLP